MEIKHFKKISLESWIKVSVFIMACLVLAIAFNFAFDNQTAIKLKADINAFEIPDDGSGFFDWQAQNYMVLWLSTLDQNTYDDLTSADKNLPLCVTHYIVNKPEQVEYNFNRNAFWFDFKNGAQVEFSRSGKISCYIQTDQENVKVLVQNCYDVCPGGIDDFGKELEINSAPKVGGAPGGPMQ